MTPTSNLAGIPWAWLVAYFHPHPVAEWARMRWEQFNA